MQEKDEQEKLRNVQAPAETYSKQEKLAFDFGAPYLEFKGDNIRARIHWRMQGEIVAEHKQYLVNSMSKDKRTKLCSPWMLSAEARRKLEETLAELQKGSSWLDMYEFTFTV